VGTLLEPIEGDNGTNGNFQNQITTGM